MHYEATTLVVYLTLVTHKSTKMLFTLLYIQAEACQHFTLACHIPYET